MKLSELAFGLHYTFLTPARKAEAQYYLDRQCDVMKVMAVLPGKYRYDQVDAAVNALVSILSRCTEVLHRESLQKC